MSWNTVLTFIEHQTPEQLRAQVTDFDTASGEVSFEDATSLWSEGIALGTAGGWTVLCHSAALPMADPELLTRLAMSGRALGLILGGTGDVYGFQLAQDGQHRRELIWSAGEAVQDSGDPLPEEATLPADEHGEDWIFGLMEAVTGLSLDDLLPVVFKVWVAAP